jgi:glycosyltransferase involved in cell wall biosynthesis
VSCQPLMIRSDLNQSRRGLRVGIDARAATEVEAGRGRFVREVLNALNQQDDLNSYVCYARQQWREPLGDRFSWRVVDLPDALWHLRTAVAASRDCDVFLSTNSYLIAMLLRIPCVVVVHDLLAFDGAMGVPRSSVFMERATLPVVVRCADRFVGVSQATVTALEHRFPTTLGRTTVAHLAASPTRDRPSVAELDSLPASGFVLSVGTLEPRKNLPRLASAYAALPAELQAAHPLVVVGALGWRHEATVSALNALGDRCRRLGSVSDGLLGELYRRCSAFCYPSLGEGFGLPVLEAMAEGAPVITSNVSALPEVGGDAVEYVDPRSISSISAGLQRVLSDPHHAAELSERGRTRALTFSWQQVACEIVKAADAAARRA